MVKAAAEVSLQVKTLLSRVPIAAQRGEASPLPAEQSKLELASKVLKCGWLELQRICDGRSANSREWFYRHGTGQPEVSRHIAAQRQLPTVPGNGISRGSGNCPGAGKRVSRDGGDTGSQCRGPEEEPPGPGAIGASEPRYSEIVRGLGYGLFEAMQVVGTVAHAVVVGRRTQSQHLPNDEIARMVSADSLFLGIGSADPVIQGAKTGIAEAERALRTLGIKGIDVEPGFGTPARRDGDIAYFPLYEFCQDSGIPVFLMSGPTTPNPRYNDPEAPGNPARQFPRLKLAAYHGYLPNVQEALGVAFRHENVSLVADMYLFQVGSRAYAEAANSFLGEQLLFGSSYPFRPVSQSIEDASRLGLKDKALANFFHRNAERLLGL